MYCMCAGLKFLRNPRTGVTAGSGTSGTSSSGGGSSAQSDNDDDSMSSSSSDGEDAGVMAYGVFLINVRMFQQLMLDLSKHTV